MLNKTNLLTLYVLLVLCGCVKEMEVDFGEPSKKIVLYPFLTFNKPITIKMSAPAGILSNEFPDLYNAFVIITDNDAPVDTVIINDKGNGISDIKPERDHLYGFYATADGYPIASCSSELPEPVQEIKIDTFHFSARNVSFLNFKVTIKDDPNSLNFYKISIFRKKYITTRISFNRDTSYVSISKTQVLANNPMIDFFTIWSENLLLAKDVINLTGEFHYRYEIGSEEYLFGQDYFLKDILFNGREASVNLIVPVVNLSIFPERFIIEISSLSKDYYQGLRSYAVYGSKEDLDLPIKEEVSIYSAVNGGYGFPVSYTTVCDSSFWLKK